MSPRTPVLSTFASRQTSCGSTVFHVIWVRYYSTPTVDEDSLAREDAVMLCQAVRVLCAALLLAAGVIGRQFPDIHTDPTPARDTRLDMQPPAPTLMWTRYWDVQVRDRPTGAVLS